MRPIVQHAAGDDMIQVNLIPDGAVTAQRMRRHARAWSVALGCCVVILAVPLIMDAVGHARVRALQDERTRVLGAVGAARANVHGMAARAALLHTQIERARALRTKRAWSALLITVAMCMPDDLWLTYFGTDPETPSATGSRRRVAAARGAAGAGPTSAAAAATIDTPRRIRLRGYAADHAKLYAFMTQLNQTGVFDRVTLVMSVVKPVHDGTAVAFSLECDW
ncbi:MAG: PilN domain-containing protein [Phycisphaerae bacterium]